MSNASSRKLGWTEILLALCLALLLTTAGCVDVEYGMNARFRTQSPNVETAYFNVDTPVIVPVEAYNPKLKTAKPVDPNDVEIKVNPTPNRESRTRFAKFGGGAK
ncbi:MAG: hypothetical protein DRP55_07760 [Spirochaetes bacterium]|nr:MAG: hypothetical protein DRP55_07760 [Spirochaetota bacterium]